jgi:hypothetical protein
VVLQLLQRLDPVSLTTQTIGEHLMHKYTAPLPYADFQRLHPVVNQRHVSEKPGPRCHPATDACVPVQSLSGAPDSALSPYNTGLDTFARWASVPIYAPGNRDKNSPDAACLAGDLVRLAPPSHALPRPSIL